MQIAVCDDEQNFRADIQRMITNSRAGCRADLFGSGEALLASGARYDIYFLDVQMPGLNGTQTAERIRRREKAENRSESIIIFVTSFPDFWDKAFDVKAFHYLVKPVDGDKFKTVFARAVSDLLGRKERADRHILVKNRDSYVKVPLNDIFYIESQNKKVIVNTAGGAVDYYGKIGDLEGALGSGFYRCHRCYIVNMEKIAKYNASEIWLHNGSRVFLAHKKYKEFVKTYLNFAKGGELAYD